MGRPLLLPGVHQARLSLQLALEGLHLRFQRVQLALLRVQHVAELLEEFSLLHVPELQLDKARLVHGVGNTMKTLEYMLRARELLARGQEELAESALSEAIDAAVAAENLVLLTQARMALGELLVAQGRHEEALPFLQAVVRTEIADGSVDAEVKRAAHLLRQMRGVEP